jgi:hypothetical protein
VRPYLKNTQCKNKAGGVAQMVECLSSKLEALSVNPNTAKKNKTITKFEKKNSQTI